MNLLNTDIINGKTLTQPQKNLLKMLHDKYGVRTFTDNLEVRRNPVNGIPSHPLHPIIAALVDVVLVSYGNYSMFGEMSINGVKMAIGVFDRVKMMILSLDAKAYSTLID